MTAVTLSPIYNAYQGFDPNGVPLAGGQLFTYEAGSFSILQTTYSDFAGAIPNSNPIILDSSGRIDTEIWLDSSLQYNFVLEDSSGNTLADTDNVGGIGLPLGGATPVPLKINYQPGNYTLQQTDMNNTLILVNSNTTAMITVPSDATHNFPIGTNILVGWAGLGQVGVQPDGGACVIVSPGTLYIANQNNMAALIKTAANFWYFVGGTGPYMNTANYTLSPLNIVNGTDRTLTIIGAQPNAPVTLTDHLYPSGFEDGGSVIGTTDSSGNFTWTGVGFAWGSDTSAISLLSVGGIPVATFNEFNTATYILTPSNLPEGGIRTLTITGATPLKAVTSQDLLQPSGTLSPSTPGPLGTTDSSGNLTWTGTPFAWGSDTSNTMSLWVNGVLVKSFYEIKV